MKEILLFQDRNHAGRLLGAALQHLKGQRCVVLGIPRGGVVVAKEISGMLDADLDIALSHKLGAPLNPELAIGSVSESGKTFLDDSIISRIGAEKKYIKEETARQLARLKEKVALFRKALPKLSLENRIVIIVDDGIATGATMQASLWSARQEKPKRLIAALPVGSHEAIDKISDYADEVTCLLIPDFFASVGQFYVEFDQTSDEEVLEILKNLQNK